MGERNKIGECEDIESGERQTVGGMEGLEAVTAGQVGLECSRGNTVKDGILGYDC